MDAEVLKKFKEIVQQYNLFEETKAEEIAQYVTDHKKTGFTLEEFARDFLMDKKDAQIFLSVIYKGIELRKKHFDPQRD